jgi:hypothetical protein
MQQICQQLVVRRDLERHVAECESRPVKCLHCNDTHRFFVAEAHERHCHAKEVECENEGCSVVVQRGEMEDHCEECEFQSVACPCPGCETKVRRRDVQAHIAPGTPHDAHVLALIKRNQELASQVSELESRIRKDVGVAVFEWSIDRGWGGDRGSKVGSATVRCGQFKIRLVFSKLLHGTEDDDDDEFAFSVQLDDEHVKLEADMEILIVPKDEATYVSLKVPRMEDVPIADGCGGDPGFTGICADRDHIFSPTARDKEGTTLDDGAIVARVVVRLKLSYSDGHSPCVESRLPRISDA